MKDYYESSAPHYDADSNVASTVNDNPERRIRETTLDMLEEELPLSKLRLKALADAKNLPIDDEGTAQSPIEDYKYSQPGDPGKSNWLQLGPTAIPDGQTLSSYYGGNIPGLVTGRITSIVIDPNDSKIIYLGSALGGIWKSTDGGRNWGAKSDYAPSLGIGALVMDPIHHNILYAGTGEGNIAWSEPIGRSHPRSYYGCGILKSTDSGETWKLIGENDNIFNGTSFYRIAIDPIIPSIIFAATTYGLFRSNNEGQEWEQMKNGLSFEDSSKVTDVVIHPKKSNIVYAAVANKGIYKTENAKDSNPLWHALDITGFNPENVTRIALAISKSSPNYLYALMASFDRPLDETYEDPAERRSQLIDQFYVFDEYGNNSKRIKLPGIGTRYSPWPKDSIGGQGYYNLNIEVDPTNSGIVYLSGISVWKAIRYNNNEDMWDIRDIGKPIHPDHHAFAFDPQNASIIYAGNDGGIYRSINSGETWIDEINEGLCITQFEVMDQHPTTDALIISGTQDNGTLIYRNGPAFYFAAFGDGGFVSIDHNNPTNIIHQYTSNHLYHSKLAGKIDSWLYIPVGYLEDNEFKDAPSLFYAPFTLDKENPKNIGFGSNRIFLDTNQGLNKWRTSDGRENSIKLDFIDNENGELISAISYVNSKLIYAGTIYGKVIRCERNQDGWDAVRIDKDLPIRYIWDIHVMPNDLNAIIIVMAGFGSQTSASGIWLGKMNPENNNLFQWTDKISGTGIGQLPHSPINAIVVDDDYPHTVYLGTDIGVFRRSKNGDAWLRFSQGLPNSAIYDMRLLKVNRQKFLRVATHGRGIWERELEVKSYKDVGLYVRNNLMDTAHYPTSDDLIFAAFSDQLQGENENGIHLNDILSWDMCPDIKTDSPRGPLSLYQYETVDEVDYVKFECRLQHRNPKRATWSNLYVQLHNRGIQPLVKGVVVKLFYANLLENGKYPELPQDFWTSFPNNTFDDTYWKPIEEYKAIPNGPKILTNVEPTILVWQWYVPSDVRNKVGILVVVESSEDPIDENNKIYNVDELVKRDSHVGLKTISVID